MNILYCGDQGIKDGLLVSILSLLKNAKSPLHIYLLTIDCDFSKPISDRTATYLDKIVKEKNKNNFVKKIDATDLFLKNLPTKNLNTVFTRKYFKPCAMLRLYIDKVSELPDKLLYLDYDVICRMDPSEFYNTDLAGVEVAGALDIYGKIFYHYNFPKTDYMNSGVLLFNMPECKKSKLFPRSVKICQEKRMMLADQAALNKTITKRKLMPRKFNEQQDHPKPDTVFHHFSNNFKFWPFFHVQKIKPFEVDKIHRILKITEYDDILNDYLKKKGNL